jgi:hypothetical protein
VTNMKRRTFELTEHTGSKGRSFLAEAGDYFIEEKLDGETTGRLGRFSYTAATVLSSELEGAVNDFIDDNRQGCSCGASWIILDSLPALFCPRCQERINV